MIDCDLADQFLAIHASKQCGRVSLAGVLHVNSDAKCDVVQADPVAHLGDGSVAAQFSAAIPRWRVPSIDRLALEQSHARPNRTGRARLTLRRFGHVTLNHSGSDGNAAAREKKNKRTANTTLSNRPNCHGPRATHSGTGGKKSADFKSRNVRSRSALLILLSL